MSNTDNEKWLSQQLLDIFYEKQIRDLSPTIVGKTKAGVLRWKKSPKFTSAIKMILLAITKYESCFMKIKTIGDFASLAKTNVIDNLSILRENNIVVIEKRFKKSGDQDSSLYKINLDVLKCFFESVGTRNSKEKVVMNHNQVGKNKKISSVDKSMNNSEGVVMNHNQGGYDSLPGVVMNHNPNIINRFNKRINKELLLLEKRKEQELNTSISSQNKARRKLELAKRLNEIDPSKSCVDHLREIESKIH